MTGLAAAATTLGCLACALTLLCAFWSRFQQKEMPEVYPMGSAYVIPLLVASAAGVNDFRACNIILDLSGRTLNHVNRSSLRAFPHGRKHCHNNSWGLRRSFQLDRTNSGPVRSWPSPRGFVDSYPSNADGASFPDGAGSIAAAPAAGRISIAWPGVQSAVASADDCGVACASLHRISSGGIWLDCPI
eukprot:SAG31_NODE_1313_length_8853_cov_60.435458_8_plen_188_part_00